MKEIIFSALFLIIEVGCLLWFASAGALNIKFALLLLVLIAKNVFILYSALKSD